MVMRFEEGENFAALLERGTLPAKTSCCASCCRSSTAWSWCTTPASSIATSSRTTSTSATTAARCCSTSARRARRSGTSRTRDDPGRARLRAVRAVLQRLGETRDRGPTSTGSARPATAPSPDARRSTPSRAARESSAARRTCWCRRPSIGAGRYSARLLAAIDHALAFAEKDRPQTIELWRKELVGAGSAAAAAPKSASPARDGACANAGPRPRQDARRAHRRDRCRGRRDRGHRRRRWRLSDDARGEAGHSADSACACRIDEEGGEDGSGSSGRTGRRGGQSRREESCGGTGGSKSSGSGGGSEAGGN